MMLLETVVEKIVNAIDGNELPGAEAQYKMSSIGRKNRVFQTFGSKPHKIGAVLILLYPDDDKVLFPLTQRHSYDGVHSGQVSLPGGKLEETDADTRETALRETEEEIGVGAHSVQVIGKLTELYIPPSNFHVYPYVGYMKEKPAMKKDDFEVSELFETSINALLDDDMVRETKVQVPGNIRIKTPYFHFNEKVVWGATAMILNELKEILKR